MNAPPCVLDIIVFTMNKGSSTWSIANLGSPATKAGQHHSTTQASNVRRRQVGGDVIELRCAEGPFEDTHAAIVAIDGIQNRTG